LGSCIRGQYRVGQVATSKLEAFFSYPATGPSVKRQSHSGRRRPCPVRLSERVRMSGNEASIRPPSSLAIRKTARKTSCVRASDNAARTRVRTTRGIPE
jgi:hypothetical protein